MSIRNLILITMMAALLTSSGTNGLALFTHASLGTIVSIESNRLVLAHKKNGKAESICFELTPATVRKGNLAVGAIVSVHYRIVRSGRLATSIQAQPPTH